MTTTRKVQIIGGIVLIAAVGISLPYFNSKESEATRQTTDDAYVKADFTAISPRISGTISQVSIQENQPIKAGQALLSIDDRDLRVALNSARAQVATAQAGIASLEAQIERQSSLQQEARTQITADSADLTLAKANQERFTNLSSDGSASLQAKQQADAQYQVQLARQQKSRSTLSAVEQQTSVLRADLQRARANLEQAQATQAAAELNLSYTHLTAPVDGVVAQNDARTGAFVAAGKPVLTIVPLNAVYVEASFRELQLARMRVGQPVAMSVDALPGLSLHGHVESLAPATGVSFSPLPAHNATGNFTKIVQRLPVRISIDPGQQDALALRVGMSVHPVIDVQANTDLGKSPANPKS